MKTKGKIHINSIDKFLSDLDIRYEPRLPDPNGYEHPYFELSEVFENEYLSEISASATATFRVFKKTSFIRSGRKEIFGWEEQT